jgi:hypothetical protein
MTAALNSGLRIQIDLIAEAWLACKPLVDLKR